MDNCYIIFMWTEVPKILFAVHRKCISSVTTKNDLQAYLKLGKLERKYRKENDFEKIQMLNKNKWVAYSVVYGSDRWREISHAFFVRKRAKARARKRIQWMFDKYPEVFFLTLTFSNDTLESTSERTRHRYVAQFLNAHCGDYIANIDYGDKNQREHFHATVAGFDNSTEWEKYGFMKIDNCGKSSLDKTRISKYINKLTNHAGKLTAGKMFCKRSIYRGEDLDKLPF